MHLGSILFRLEVLVVMIPLVLWVAGSLYYLTSPDMFQRMGAIGVVALIIHLATGKSVLTSARGKGLVTAAFHQRINRLLGWREAGIGVIATLQWGFGDCFSSYVTQEGASPCCC